MKNRTRNLSTVMSLIVIVTLAIWQFYLFVTFRNPEGVVDVQGGTYHLWWTIGLTVVACIGSFLFYSDILRYDRNDEVHIASLQS